MYKTQLIVINHSIQTLVYKLRDQGNIRSEEFSDCVNEYMDVISLVPTTSQLLNVLSSVTWV